MFPVSSLLHSPLRVSRVCKDNIHILVASFHHIIFKDPGIGVEDNLWAGNMVAEFMPKAHA